MLKKLNCLLWCLLYKTMICCLNSVHYYLLTIITFSNSPGVTRKFSKHGLYIWNFCQQLWRKSWRTLSKFSITNSFQFSINVAATFILTENFGQNFVKIYVKNYFDELSISQKSIRLNFDGLTVHQKKSIKICEESVEKSILTVFFWRTIFLQNFR